MTYDKDNTRPSRSAKYQYAMVETPCTHEFIATFERGGDETDLFADDIKQQVAELRDTLIQQTRTLMERILTPTQWAIMKLHLQGKGQKEIADILGVNQSSITKSLNGNVDYVYSGGAKVYGGAMKKVRKHVQHDPDIQKTLIAIARAQEVPIQLTASERALKHWRMNRARMVASRQNRPKLSPEQRQGFVERTTKLWQDPVIRQRILDGMHRAKKRPKRSDAFKEHRRIAMRLNWQDPTFRAKVAATKQATRERKANLKKSKAAGYITKD